ncbi:MAG TPA: trehalose-phosphatase [Xanthobacteraceae bacterium]|nr:trehalose-phosphatase [Xanthobacteraceae bacterium]
MNVIPSSMTLPELRNPDRLALFLDFDGTLVAIGNRPDDVRLDPETREALTDLNRLLAGALAIVTGRDIATADHFLAPLRLSIAGVHGLMRRDAQGNTYASMVDSRLPAAIERAVSPLLAKHPGLLVERKHGALALHYRAHPELEQASIEAMENAIGELRETEIMRGKMVVEVKALGGNKGTAIMDFLNEKPFAGRQAVFAGDDATDEDAFAAVNARDGISIKIGPGATHATYRAAGTAEFLTWLRQLPTQLRG